MKENTATDLQTLEALVVDNPDLERLEALLDQFNIFEAIGATHVELRHSDFLAFLLNPEQPHGLGDDFVKRLLQKSLGDASSNDVPITPIDLDIWDLDGLEVRREWRNIDLLLLDEDHNMAVIIENKIKSGEHSNQLHRYWKIVQNRFPNFRTWALYLTPEGDQPSHEEYDPISYTMIAELVENLLQTRQSTLGPDVYTLMEHYAQMLRRHIVTESEIAQLCRRIYRKHQRALDMIYEYRPDLQEEIRQVLVDLVEKESGLTLAYSTKTHIRFFPSEWDISKLKADETWVHGGQLFLFYFKNEQERLRLKLAVGPGKPEISRRLFEMARQNEKSTPLQTFFKKPNRKQNTIYIRPFLDPEHYENVSVDDLEQRVQNEWDLFLKRDLPDIKDTIRKQKWIWEGE
jgi:hypothetical protein